MDEKTFKAWVGTRKQVGELKAQGKEAESKVASRRVGAKGEFVNSDGKEFQASTEKEGESLRTTKAGLDTISQMRNEIARGIAEHGGESDYLRSDAWQRQKSRYAQILVNASKTLELGALDEGAVKIAEQMAGDVDPTSYIRDARAGLDQLVDGLSARFNAKMLSQDYTGAPYEPKKATNLPPPKTDVVDKAYKELSKSYAGQSETGRDRPEGWTTQGVLEDIAEYGGGQTISRDLARRGRIAEDTTKAADQLDAIYRAATDAKGEARDKALAYLKKLAEGAPSDELRSQAFQLYNAALAVRSGQGGARAR
jgi:hypothetical protein